MKRMLSKINKKNNDNSASTTTNAPRFAFNSDSPEAVIAREVTAFCESGAPGAPDAGNEYLHLPAIVDAAESSPAAAKEAAATVRHFLSRDFYAKGYAQYNAIMLTRILTDNPGRVFTQNFDAQFVTSIKRLLREGNDLSVQQILRETLDYWEVEKAPSNETLRPLIQMWIKEKSKSNSLLNVPPGVSISHVFIQGPSAQAGQNLAPSRPQQYNSHYQTGPYQTGPYQTGPYQTSSSRGLPPPDELAARIEEAKTTARLLIQTIQSTPQSELQTNELVNEFAGRVRSAHNSVQRYMNTDNPAPDADTMITLIETNDQLHVALTKYQRSIVQARTATRSPPQAASPPGQASSTPPILPARDEQFAPPPGPPSHFQPQPTLEIAASQNPLPTRNGQDYADPQTQTQASTVNTNSVGKNPFSDDAYRDDGLSQPQNRYSLFGRTTPHTDASGQSQAVESRSSEQGQNLTQGSTVHEIGSSATNFATHQGSTGIAENR